MKKINFKALLIIILMLLISPFYVFAKDIQEKYNGDYSLDYLLRNYNLISFGINSNDHLDIVSENLSLNKDNANLSAEGPVLINGSLVNDSLEKLEYSTKETNKTSYIKGTKGSNVETLGNTATNSDFIDFDKLYKQVVAESNALLEKTEYHINAKNIQLDKSGIYQIDNIRPYLDPDYSHYVYPGKYYFNFVCDYYNDNYQNRICPERFSLVEIYIDNYDLNEYYIFNNSKMYEFDNYVVYVKTSEDNEFKTIEELVKSNNYTGNIIFNYPNAKFISLNQYSGKVIAPKADVILFNLELYDMNTSSYYVNYHDSLFVNSVQGFVFRELDLPFISFTPYSASKKINITGMKVKDVVDYGDDLYTGDYSIVDMLKNYNIVTLGQKEYDSKTRFSNRYLNYNYRYANGDANIFHVVGQVLVNGELTVSRLDLEANRIHESYTKFYNGLEQWGYAFKSWGDEDSQYGTNSNLFVNTEVFCHDEYSSYYNEECYLDSEREYIDATSGVLGDRMIVNKTPYINFKRLYDSIVSEQKNIKKGSSVSIDSKTAHIEIGKNYYIDNINDIDEIIFDNFASNENELTVITVLNSGDVNFPIISQGSSKNPVSTKDYFGKKEAMFAYEYYNFPEDIYHGNIIWNFPNAKYIKLASDAPFMGHLVAPNADVETPETHFSGTFIVNSLYAEGNTEAHFYPLQVVNMPEDYDSEDTSIQFGYLGYNGEYTSYNDNESDSNISNPSTRRSYEIIILILFIVGNIWIIKYRNRKQVNS